MKPVPVWWPIAQAQKFPPSWHWPILVFQPLIRNSEAGHYSEKLQYSAVHVLDPSHAAWNTLKCQSILSLKLLVSKNKWPPSSQSLRPFGQIVHFDQNLCSKFKLGSVVISVLKNIAQMKGYRQFIIWRSNQRIGFKSCGATFSFLENVPISRI